MTTPEPTHLDQRDPAMADARDVREEADREIDAHQERRDLVLLMPEDRWDEFLRLTGAADRGGAASYRGVAFRRAAVTAIIPQEGF
ncbi:MAG TPA: hypothetical protein VIE16_01755 [Phenylobacterium sp.]|jgi:hypothetical protein